MTEDRVREWQAFRLGRLNGLANLLEKHVLDLHAARTAKGEAVQCDDVAQINVFIENIAAEARQLGCLIEKPNQHGG